MFRRYEEERRRCLIRKTHNLVSLVTARAAVSVACRGSFTFSVAENWPEEQREEKGEREDAKSSPVN